MASGVRTFRLPCELERRWVVSRGRGGEVGLRISLRSPLVEGRRDVRRNDAKLGLGLRRERAACARESMEPHLPGARGDIRGEIRSAIRDEIGGEVAVRGVRRELYLCRVLSRKGVRTISLRVYTPGRQALRARAAGSSLTTPSRRLNESTLAPASARVACTCHVAITESSRSPGALACWPAGITRRGGAAPCAWLVGPAPSEARDV